MILYNVTYGIDTEIESEWLQWMKQVHIPAVLQTGLFESYRLYKVLSVEEGSSPSYCVQYFTPTIEQFNLYLEKFAALFMQEHLTHFSGRHVAFNTLLEEVN